MHSFHVERAGNTPLYEQLYRQLRDAIAGGLCRPGDTLPTFRKLAAETGVGGKTSRRALLRLVARRLRRDRPRPAQGRRRPAAPHRGDASLSVAG